MYCDTCATIKNEPIKNITTMESLKEAAKEFADQYCESQAHLVYAAPEELISSFIAGAQWMVSKNIKKKDKQKKQPCQESE
jgi:hypothetical protein